MTWAQMGCTPEELARRQNVCTRINKLWDKRQKCTDEKTRKQIDRKIAVLTRQEAPWLRRIAWFAY